MSILMLYSSLYILCQSFYYILNIIPYRAGIRGGLGPQFGPGNFGESGPPYVLAGPLISKKNHFCLKD